jgi:hypothetical protein
MLQFTPIAPGHSVQEVAIPEDWVGKSRARGSASR